MNSAGRKAALALCIACLLVGCTPQPAGSAGAGQERARAEYPPPPPGAYPPLPPARRTQIRWASPRKYWRTVVADKSEPGLYGRESVSLDGSRLAYGRNTYTEEAGHQPTELVLREAGGRLRTLRKALVGRAIPEIRLHCPWVVWLDIAQDNRADWVLRARNLDRQVEWVVARPDERVGDRQLTPTIDLSGRLLVWEQRIQSGRGLQNVVKAYDLASRDSCTVGGPGPVHDPAVGGGTVYWNEEFTRPEGKRLRIFDDIYAAEPGSRRRRATFTGFGRFCSASSNTLTWLDARRYWAGQQSMTDIYFRRRNGPTTRVTSHGYADLSLAGDDLIAWVEFPGIICALDLRTNRGYRLTGSGGRQAALLDVEGRRVAYELSPSVWDPKPWGRTQLRVIELWR